jgi:uncharacterized protein (TIGR02996 family)
MARKQHREPSMPAAVQTASSGVQAVNIEDAFLTAILAEPSDLTTRLIFADWLEEQGDPRAELLRLLHVLTQEISPPDRPGREARLRELLKSGVKPVGPFWTNSIGMRFACIPSGTFLMGSPKEEQGREPYTQLNETQHKVTLTKGFFMGVHPVTQEQWQTVMGNNPSHFTGEKHLPVETVSWEDCQEFINRLGEKDKKLYRLPTEAEWEYACRAGTKSPFYFGETISADQANYDGNYTYGAGKKGVSRWKTTPVGSFPPNAFGLFDMHGNVWEWCLDWFGDYPQNDEVDPQGLDKGTYRVLRGGSGNNLPQYCRSASRNWYEPGYRNLNCGLRVCFCLD